MNDTLRFLSSRRSYTYLVTFCGLCHIDFSRVAQVVTEAKHVGFEFPSLDATWRVRLERRWTANWLARRASERTILSERYLSVSVSLSHCLSLRVAVITLADRCWFRCHGDERRQGDANDNGAFRGTRQQRQQRVVAGEMRATSVSR